MNSYDIVNRMKVLISTERKSSRKANVLLQLQRKYEEYIAQGVPRADNLYREKRLRKKPTFTHSEYRTKEMPEMLLNMQVLVDDQRNLCEPLKKDKQQQICIRETNDAMMDKLHTLEENTGLYINFNCLPEHIQGMAVRRTENDVKWTNLDINPSKYKIEQVQDQVWEKIEIDQKNNHEWTQLFFEPENAAMNND